MNSSGDPKQKMRAETVAMLRAVLISSPLGVRFTKLYKDYKQLTGKTIPYQELGFPKLEYFIQSIPDVARAEKGADGEWTLKGVACESDKHVAKLISKQKKPKIRKSAKLMLSRKPSRYNPPPGRYNSPVKHPPRQLFMVNTQRFMPPRMQKLQKMQQGRGTGRTVTLNVPDLRHKISGRAEGTFGGALFQKTTDNVRASRTNTRTTGARTVTSRSNSWPNFQEKGPSKDGSGAVYQPMSVSISNTNTGRSVRAVTATSPVQHSSSGALNDDALVKWIKVEISKAPNGLWATRLVVLYQEKFKKALADSTVKELKYRPDIARVEEPIDGRYLLYAAKSHEKVQVVVRNVAVQDSIEPKRPSPPKQILDITLHYDFPDVNGSCCVYVTHVQNVDCFYVSKTDAISETLNAQILEHYESSKPNPDAIPSVMPDQIFCAQFSEDKCFYRARVLEVVDHKRVLVLYVDFGNQEVIEVKSLRILAEQFHSQPVQAFQCSLDSVQSANEDQNWNEAALSKFSELTYDKALKMTVKDIEDKTLSVILYDESLKLDIGDELIKAGVATSTVNLSSTPSSSSSSLSSSTGATSENITPPKKEALSRSRRVKPKSPGTVEVPDDTFIDVLVCNITGTFNIYLRLVGEEYSKKFESIQESMTCYYGASEDAVTTEPAVGDLFALLSEEVWCRVKVVSISGETIHVFFVDHADEVNTSKAELRVLAPQFQQLPFQVFRCALNGLPKTKNPDVVDKLQKLVMGEVCVAEVFEKSADLVFIELIDTRSDANIVVNDIIRTLVMPDEELKPVLPKVGKTIEVDVPYVSPSGSVFLHVLAAGTKRLDELNKDLTEHYIAKRSKANEFVSDPSVGKVCCAKCDEDGNWYRVKIISASNRNAVEVMYVDYGNTDTVPSTNLREPTQANEHVLSLPFQALECQLYDVPKSDWNEDLANRIMEIIAQGTVTVEVLSDGNPPSVSLLVTIGEKDDEASTQRLTSLLGITFEDDLLLEEDADGPIVNNGETTINAADESAQITANGNGKSTALEHEKIVEENEKSAVATNETVSIEESGIVSVEESEKVSIEESEKYIVDENGENVVGDGDKIDAGEGGEATAIDGGKADEAGKAPIGEEKMAVNQANANVNGVHCVQESGDDSFEGEVVEEVAEVPFAWKELPLDSGWMDVTVTDVKDLGNFTFQLLPNLEEFDKMAMEMNDYYQNSATEVTPVDGGVYAVLHEDDCWYRGMVESVMNNGKACVLFVDYGGQALIGEEDIRLLEKQFLELPFQGVQASLAGIKYGGKKWSRACIKDFKYNTLDRDLVAKVTSGDTNYCFSPKSRVLVELYDTSDPKQDILIAEKIIANNSDALSIT